MPNPDDSPGREPTSDAVAAELAAATAGLIAAAADLTDADLRAPSRCAGWSRGHVLSHVARNADAFTRVLAGAAAGETVPMYPSRAGRDADIEAGSRRGPGAVLADLRETADRLARAWAGLPEPARSVTLGTTGGGGFTAGDVPWLRWREVVLHHVDLDRGFTLAQAGPLVRRLLEDTVRRLAGAEHPPALRLLADDGAEWRVGADGGAEVSGSVPAITAWLTGRSAGGDLRAPYLPTLEAWG